MGVLVQPVFGRWSDRFQHPVWDRRRPFMIRGGVVVAFSLIGLATSDTSARLITSVIGLDSNILAQVLAVSWLSILHLGVQPLQVASRAYIVENCGPGNEVTATAWAGRLQGVCGILGFALASMAMSDRLPWANLFSNLTMLYLIIDILLLAMLLAACSARQYISARCLTDDAETIADEYQHTILETLRGIPLEMRHVFIVQWFSWMAWFPFTAYYTSYVNSIGERARTETTTSQHILPASPSSAGALAGLLLSLIAFASISILPMLSGVFDGSCPARWTPSRHGSTSSVLEALWGCSQLYFVVAMALTMTVHSQWGAVLLISSVGVPWGVSQWVPHGLLGIMLNRDSQSSELPSRRTDAGVVMALHNTAISAPQIISALSSSVLPMLVPRQADALGWTLRIGAGWMAIAAMLSFYFCFPLKTNEVAKPTR